jgi:hypothetical protein
VSSLVMEYHIEIQSGSDYVIEDTSICDGYEADLAAGESQLQRDCFVARLRRTPRNDAPRVDSAYSSSLRRERKASWGTSTEPTIFMRFLPSFCFSRSFLLRVTSPP